MGYVWERGTCPLFLSGAFIPSLTLSPSPVASCEQMQVLSTQHIPTTRPDSTAGTPGDTAPRFWTSAVVGICTWVY